MEFLGKIRGACDKNKPRTRFANCDVKEAATAALLFTGMDALYPYDSDEFLANLEDYVYNDGPLNMIPVKNIIDDPVTGGDIATADRGSRGGTAPTGENQTIVPYQIDAGSCFAKENYKFEGSMRFFRVDENGYIWGTIVERDGVLYRAGFTASDLFPYEVQPSGTTAYGVFLSVYYGVNYRAEKMNKDAVKGNLMSIPDGIGGLDLVAGSSTGAVKVVTACTAQDVTSTYADEWDTAVFVNESGTNPSTVVYNAQRKEITLTPAGAYKLADAATLRANGILGYEGVDNYVNTAA